MLNNFRNKLNLNSRLAHTSATVFSVVSVLIISLVLVTPFALRPSHAKATEVTFTPSQQLVNQPQPYTTTIVLNTESENINAVEGVLKVDPSLGTDIQISDSGSVVTYWVTKPYYNKEQGVVEFSGAMPGGFSGGSGILFSLILPSHTNQAPLEKALYFINFNAYKNDGLGSSAKVSTRSFGLGDIAGQVDEAIADQLYLNGKKDDIQPEVFTPRIARDPNIFNNHWFISFNTTDKQSGIDHYEIQESRTGAMNAGHWLPATSPYELVDQELHSFVFVIAVDRQGNERIIKVFPRNPLPWFQVYGKQLGVILVLGIVGGIAYYYRRRNRFENNVNINSFRSKG